MLCTYVHKEVVSTFSPNGRIREDLKHPTDEYEGVDGSTLGWRMGRMVICNSFCVLGHSCILIVLHFS